VITGARAAQLAGGADAGRLVRSWRRGEGSDVRAITLRGHVQSLRLYGTRGNPPAVVSSGDGGWMHLGPHVAEVLASRASSWSDSTSRAISRASRPGTSRCVRKTSPETTRCSPTSLRAGHAETDSRWRLGGCGLSVLAATDPRRSSPLRARSDWGFRHQRTRLAMERRADLRDARRAERADVQHGCDRASVLRRFRSRRSTRLGTSSSAVRGSESIRCRQRAEEAVDREASNHRFSDNLQEFDRRLLEAVAWIRQNAAR